MKWDFRHHLLTQIEMLRGDISHEELSERLGDVTERSLARYIAGKSHLTESEFKEVAKGSQHRCPRTRTRMGLIPRSSGIR